MNWQVILRNQWFQLCLVAAVCSAGAGLLDLTTMPGKNSLPTPTPWSTPRLTPHPSVAPLAAFVQLRAKKPGHWIVDASGAADSDSRDLYQVVNSAGSGDTITIRPGRYEAGLLINKDLAFVGEGIAPANPLIFYNRDQFNVVDVEAGHVTFSNLRIEQDFNTTYAAFYCGKQARVEIANSSVTSKSTNNVSVADDAQLDVRDSLFRSSEIGCGMLFLGRAHGTVTHCNIIGNRIGLEAQNQAQVKVDSSSFQNNGDQNGYGAMMSVDGSGATLNVDRSRFNQNAAGIYAQESGNLIMTGCTLENNGISLEGAHVTSGLITVQTAAQATLNNLVCKSNKQGISVLTAGKAQLNNVTLAATGIVTNNAQYIVYCNTLYLNGDGTTVSISGSTISEGEYNGVVIVNRAKAVVENSTITSCKYSGLIFGSDDGTPGFGTMTNSTVSNNHFAGIVVQSKSSLEINGGEISSNFTDGIDVGGQGSIGTLTNIFVRNHPKVGILAYSGGAITVKRCTIEKNQFGVQAGLSEKGREFGGSIVLEVSAVQNNTGYGAISCAGSTINLSGNKFQNGRNDYLKQSGGIIRTAN